MLGTIVNALAIILGSLLGIGVKKGIKDDYKNTIMDGIGLAVIIIGIMGGIKSENIILVIGSIVVGSIIGEVIGIENKLDNLGNFLQDKFGGKDSNFSKGFVTASLVYCVGAMAIVGSLESGIQGNHQTLFAKSILDGISAIIFASTLGIGVAFSSIPVFIYQGSITLLANFIKDLLTVQVVNEMSAVGGLLIMAIGINILGIKKIKVGNMLPAVFIPIIYYILVNLVNLIR
ncbi:hypothetical protein CIW83_19760 [Tissierella sp. P1]|jgi:uncharacterized membrane protein YqgA involved in biofilm formation|uniref:DUF554 domain-containing protein n=1 Tax=Tissierella TaxID=41273 RepID=UPI000B9FCF61|nr:DUF554 domain-containing protein [Tissierella sp. P1]MDU5079661.1 DUF554 domain-containing protein [Bacillota bacterium]OZV10518.1 hypothetical protein CIW83_19760 [Tissierella sp. P1]